MKDEDFVNSLLDMILTDIEKSVVPWKKEIKPGYFGICHERENKIDWSNPASYCLESTILVKISKKMVKYLLVNVLIMNIIHITFLGII